MKMSQPAVFVVVFRGVEHGRALVVHGAELKPGQTSCPSGACVHQQEFVWDPSGALLKAQLLALNLKTYIFIYFFLNSKKSERIKEA